MTVFNADKKFVRKNMKEVLVGVLKSKMRVEAFIKQWICIISIFNLLELLDEDRKALKVSFLHSMKITGIVQHSLTDNAKKVSEFGPNIRVRQQNTSLWYQISSLTTVPLLSSARCLKTTSSLVLVKRR